MRALVPAPALVRRSDGDHGSGGGGDDDEMEEDKEFDEVPVHTNTLSLTHARHPQLRAHACTRGQEEAEVSAATP
jgi:hypothetical protein